MLELIDFDDDDDDDNDFDTNISNHLSPNPHVPLSPDRDSPPSDHGMPPPQSPQPEPFAQRVPPRVNCYDFILCLPYSDTPHFFLFEPSMSY